MTQITFIEVELTVRTTIIQILEEEELDYQDYFSENENGKKRNGPPSNSDWKNVEVFVMFSTTMGL